MTKPRLKKKKRHHERYTKCSCPNEETHDFILEGQQALNEILEELL